MSKSAAPNLVELFQSADAEQLDAIDEAIAKLKEQQAVLQKQIDGLTTIRKALDIKLNGLPPPKPREPKAAKPKPAAGPVTASSPPGERIVALLQSRGPLSKAQIADMLDLSLSSVAVCVSRHARLGESGGLVRIVDDED